MHFAVNFTDHRGDVSRISYIRLISYRVPPSNSNEQRGGVSKCEDDDPEFWIRYAGPERPSLGTTWGAPVLFGLLIPTKNEQKTWEPNTVNLPGWVRGGRPFLLATPREAGLASRWECRRIRKWFRYFARMEIREDAFERWRFSRSNVFSSQLG